MYGTDFQKYWWKQNVQVFVSASGFFWKKSFNSLGIETASGIKKIGVDQFLAISSVRNLFLASMYDKWKNAAWCGCLQDFQ